MEFKDSTAIITGGTGAIGSSVTGYLYAKGASLVLPHSSAKAPTRMSEDIQSDKHRVLFLQTNLTVPDEVDRVVRDAAERFGSIEILVNLAGGFKAGSPLEATALDDWDEMMDKNFRTCLLMCRATMLRMRQVNYGRIINVAAQTNIRPSPNSSPYHVSKGAVVSLTEVLSRETRGVNITVNAIAPSIVLTDANRLAMPGASQKDWVTPDEIARLVGFLAMKESASISGNTIQIFGNV